MHQHSRNWYTMPHPRSIKLFLNYISLGKPGRTMVRLLNKLQIFIQANSLPEEKISHVFLTNQMPVTFKLLTNLASQQTPPKNVNNLSLDEISMFVLEQFHPKRFIVRVSSRAIWIENQVKPSRRWYHDAVTWYFPSIKDLFDVSLLKLGIILTTAAPAFTKKWYFVW